jgi:uncharacterized C2H2 Zn-finger protein
MTKFSEPDGGDYFRSVLYILLYVAVIGGGAFLLLPEWWLIWGLLVIVGVVLLISWHRGQTVYRCPNCGHVYELTFWRDLVSPHGVDKQGAWLLLRCPNCREIHKTRTLKRPES